MIVQRANARAKTRPETQERQSVTRRAISPRWVFFCLCAGAFLSQAAPASAQGRLDAHYEASLSGIPVGKGSWTIEIGVDTFSAAALGATTGHLEAFYCATGDGSAQGNN